MDGVVHDQSVNQTVTDSHDNVIIAEEPNQQTTGSDVAVNEKLSVKVNWKKVMALQLCLME